MSTSPHAHAAPAPHFLEVFRAAADENGRMRFDRFMELALYHPQIGYYRADRVRVGYGRTTDFFTASTSGPVFGELVCAACCGLLGDENPADHTFVEIGAEPGHSLLEGVAHRFGAARTLRVGEPLDLRGRCVVFSNELFDAQPFRRFAVHEGGWRELGVAVSDGSLTETVLPAAPLPLPLPAPPHEGYHLDLPLAATTLAEHLAAQPWSGLFVAFDYGRSWRELIEATPAGTARAYHRHTQHNDLLARPGEQDLTCHVCWDWLQEALAKHDFAAPRVESQEAFLIRHAMPYIAATSEADAARFSQRKLGLMQLLHHFGQKFQVLWGVRSRR